MILELLEQAPATATAGLEVHIADVSTTTGIDYVTPSAELHGTQYPSYTALVRQPPGGGRGEHNGDTAVAYGLVRYGPGNADILISVCVRITGSWDGHIDGDVARGISVRDAALRSLKVQNPGLFSS